MKWKALKFILIAELGASAALIGDHSTRVAISFAIGYAIALSFCGEWLSNEQPLARQALKIVFSAVLLAFVTTLLASLEWLISADEPDVVKWRGTVSFFVGYSVLLTLVRFAALTFDRSVGRIVTANDRKTDRKAKVPVDGYN